ncbi:hypothetical protein Tco_0831048 [Tanacetum coccineum]
MNREVDLLKLVDEEQPKTSLGDVSSVDLSEPVTYHETVSWNEATNWQDVMETEMQSMYDNQVLELVDLPSTKGLIGLSQSTYVDKESKVKVEQLAQEVRSRVLFLILLWKVEYIEPSDTATETVWLKNFQTDLGAIPSISDPLEIFCENIGAVAQAKDPRDHHKTKHIW